MRAAVVLVVLIFVAAPGVRAQDGGAPRTTTTLTVIGTNDLHGRLAALPTLSGYLANVRAARRADHGGVVLVDGGDLFQGTLESNLNEGAAVIRAYNALGYDAAAIGNHEFDFGPVGPSATPRAPGDDPQGALRARAREAHFPFLSANIADAAGHVPPAGWRNVRASVLIERAHVHVGIIGLSTPETPHTTIAANFRGLAMQPLVAAVTREAASLRQQGATVVIVTAHLGGRCRDLHSPDDSTSCDNSQEIMGLAAALAPGVVDVMVGGHTHSGMAQVVNGIPVIESFTNGTALGRVDLTLDRRTGRPLAHHIHPPEELCGIERHPPCDHATYEGAPVTVDARLRASLADAFAQGDALRNQSLSVTLAAPFRREHEAESPLGNFLADLILRARPDAQVSLMNGGGIRQNLPAGPLTYGSLYETFPFDNRFALVHLTGAELRRILADNVSSEGSLLSIAGVTVVASCNGSHHVTELRDAHGTVIADDARLTLVTSDFIATGGDRVLANLLGDAPSADRLTMPEDGPNIRDGIAAVLRSMTGTLRPDDPATFDPAHPRWSLPTPRPVRCSHR